MRDPIRRRSGRWKSWPLFSGAGSAGRCRAAQTLKLSHLWLLKGEDVDPALTLIFSCETLHLARRLCATVLQSQPPQMFNPADDNAPRVYSPEPETSPAKTFKACRHCRRLKMRCEGNGIPPCQRCTASGAECVYDAIESSKKRKRAEEEILREEIRTLQRHVASLNEARLRPITSYLQTVVDTYTANTPEQSGNDPDSRAESELSPEQLSAPVSTVHDLASTPRASSGNLHYIHSGDHSTEHLRNTQEAELAPSTDVVTKFSIKEDEARRLFHMFVHHFRLGFVRDGPF